jgi:hypothetical protein
MQTLGDWAGKFLQFLEKHSKLTMVLIMICFIVCLALIILIFKSLEYLMPTLHWLGESGLYLQIVADSFIILFCVGLIFGYFKLFSTFGKEKWYARILMILSAFLIIGLMGFCVYSYSDEMITIHKDIGTKPITQIVNFNRIYVYVSRGHRNSTKHMLLVGRTEGGELLKIEVSPWAQLRTDFCEQTIKAFREAPLYPKAANGINNYKELTKQVDSQLRRRQTETKYWPVKLTYYPNSKTVVAVEPLTK